MDKDKFNKTHKRRPSQHDVDEEGITNFRAALPTSGEFKFAFTEVTRNDYGIDAELQTFIDGVHTGEFFKVQIKSHTTAPYIRKGSQVSIVIDLKTAYFLLEDAQVPTALVTVDNATKRVFWYPIQTSDEARLLLNSTLQKEKLSNEPIITLHCDVKNELKPDNYQALYDYFKDASAFIAKRATIKSVVNGPLGAGLSLINEVQEKSLTIEGFEYKYRAPDEPPTPGVVFSVSISGGYIVDYYPGKDFRPELAPTIHINTKFSKKSKKEMAKADAFQSVVEKGEGSVQIGAENIESYQVVSGETVLEGADAVKNGVQFNILPSIDKRRSILLVSNGRDEFENKVESWMAGGIVHMQSIDTEPILLKTELDIGKGNLTATINIRVNNQRLTSVSQELCYLDFLRNGKEIIISILDTDGFKRKMFGGDFGSKKLVNENGYKFAVALKEIEDATGITVPYPLPEEIKREDAEEIFWTHRLVTGNKINKSLTVQFEMPKNPKEELEKGRALGFYQESPEITIFGRPFVLHGFTRAIKGIITDLTKSVKADSDLYTAEVKNAEITVQRAQK